MLVNPMRQTRAATCTSKLSHEYSGGEGYSLSPIQINSFLFDSLRIFTQLAFDLRPLAREPGGSLHLLRELFRQRGLLSQQRRELPALGSEPFVVHRALLQGGCQTLLKRSQTLRVAGQLVDGALMALASLR